MSKVLKIEEYLVTWWSYSGRRDDYIDHDFLISATSPENAIEIVRSKDEPYIRRGKNWKATKVKVTDFKRRIYEFID